MPCGGPSKDHAYLIGEKVFEDVKKILEESYHVREPVILDSRSAEDETLGPHGRFLEQALIVRSRLDKQEWDENMERLKSLLQEIVWADHAAGF